MVNKMVFACNALVFCVMCVVTVHGTDGEANARLESRFDCLENKVTTLSQQVAQQHIAMEEMRSQLKQKNTELDEVRLLLKDKHSFDQRRVLPLTAGAKVANRRFLLGNETDNVAFFARLNKTELAGINHDQTILFDNVVLNKGSAFDQSTGQFTVPVTGFYLISVAIASDLGHSHEIQVALMKNADILARAHAHGDSGHIDQGGITVVDQFNAGDKVYLRSVTEEVTALYGVGLTSLSGIRIMFK